MSENNDKKAPQKIKVSAAPELKKKNVNQRWMLVAGAVILGTVAASQLMGGKKEAPPPAEKLMEESVIDVTPKGLTKATWQAQTQGDIKRILEESKKKDEQIRLLQEGFKKLEGKIEDAKNTTPIASKTKNTEESGPVTPPPPPPVPKSSNVFEQNAEKNSAFQEKVDNVNNAGKTKVVEQNNTVSNKSNGILAYNYVPLENSDTGERMVKSKKTYVKNDFASYVSEGSLIEVALLTGIEASTSTAAQGTPQPVLMRIQNLATMPGYEKYDLVGCFVLGSAYGDASSERVYVRTTKLSCRDKDNKLVLVQNFEAQMLDNDATLGLRGKVLDRQGAKLAKAMLAGFAQGLGTALGTAQGTTTTSSTGVASTLTGGEAMRQAGFTGAANAANTLAQFYLKEAQNLFPVIAVSSGRKASLVVLTGASLKWNDGSDLYIEKIVPDNGTSNSNSNSSQK